jgi:peptide/nickel transport system ATP-binding protein
MLISHDLSTVRAICDEVMVLYAGQMVEYGNRNALLAAPRHPYTDLLIASVPELRPGWLDGLAPIRLAEAAGGVAAFSEAPCAFAPRCPMRLDAVCATEPPPVQTLAKGAAIRCHRTAQDLLVAQTDLDLTPHDRSHADA